MLAVACSATVETDRREPSHAEVYQRGMLEQLADAWRDRDLDRMEELLERPRTGATAEQRERFETFATLLRGVRIAADGFARHGFAWGTASAEAGAPPDLEMDEPLPVRVILRPGGDRELRIHARNDGGGKTAFLVSVTIDDWLEDGSRVRSSMPFRYEPGGDVVIAPSRPFERAVPEPDPPGTQVKMRRVELSGTVMFAALSEGGELLPVRRLTLDALVLRRFPKGFRKVRENPLRILQVAAGRPSDHLAHILVASWFLARDGDDRQQRAGTRVLIDLLRAGPAACEKTARASLLWLAGDDAPAQRDREGWLRWWTLRQRGGRR